MMTNMANTPINFRALSAFISDFLLFTREVIIFTISPFTIRLYILFMIYI